MQGRCSCGWQIVNPFTQEIGTGGGKRAILIICRSCKQVLGAVNGD